MEFSHRYFTEVTNVKFRYTRYLLQVRLMYFFLKKSAESVLLHLFNAVTHKISFFKVMII